MTIARMFFCIICLVVAPALYAEETKLLFNMSLEELSKISVVYAASGFKQKTSKAPATVTVITNDELQARGARTLSDVLISVPGVHVSESQIQYNHKQFIIRGLSGDYSSQVKILIDGEPFYNMQSSGIANGFHLPLTSFKQIEVIKGPGSAIYGADAFAGIINLVSYQQNEMKTNVGGRIGSFDSYDLFAKHELFIGNSHLQLSFDYSKSNDDPERIINTDLQSVFDSIFATSASQAPGPIDEHYEVMSAMAKWRWHKLSLNYFTWRNFDMGLGGGIAQALDSKGSASTKHNQYLAKYDLSDYVDSNLIATFSYKNQWNQSFLNVFPAGSVLPIGADGNLDFSTPTTVALFSDGYIGTPSSGGNVTAYRLTHLFNINENHLFRWETGYERLKFNATERKNFGPSVLLGTETVVTGRLTDVSGTPYVYLPDVKRSFYYLSIQDEWQLQPNLQFTLGARYDNYSDFGARTNPRLGLIWQTSDALTMKFFAGTAIKAPSIAQLYSQNNPVGLGNSSLQSEKVETIETGMGLEYFVNENMLISASFYKYHARDLVKFVFDEEQRGNVAQNIGELKGKGAELSFKWKPYNNVSLDANYSVVQSENEASVDTPDIPRNMAYLGIAWQPSGNWSWNLNAKWVGNRVRAITDTRDKLASYTWLTSKLQLTDIIKGVDAAIIINNALDTEAREPSNGSIADDYPQPGRQVLLEMNYRF